MRGVCVCWYDSIYLFILIVLYYLVQSAAIRCSRSYSVLQCVAVCCSVLQYVAVCCSVLQCVAVCCSVLQCVAVCCSAAAGEYLCMCVRCVAVCCSVSQCVAVCCSVLQCVAVCCSAAAGAYRFIVCARVSFYLLVYFHINTIGAVSSNTCKSQCVCVLIGIYASDYLYSFTC